MIRLDYMPSTQGDGIAYSTNIGSQSEYKGIVFHFEVNIVHLDGSSRGLLHDSNLKN